MDSGDLASLLGSAVVHQPIFAAAMAGGHDHGFEPNPAEDEGDTEVEDEGFETASDPDGEDDAAAPAPSLLSKLINCLGGNGEVADESAAAVADEDAVDVGDGGGGGEVPPREASQDSEVADRYEISKPELKSVEDLGDMGVIVESEPAADPINESDDLKQVESELEAQKDADTGCELKTALEEEVVVESSEMSSNLEPFETLAPVQINENGNLKQHESETAEKGVDLDVLKSEEQAVELLTAVAHVESSETLAAVPINENGELKKLVSELESEKNEGTGCESKTAEMGVDLDILKSEEQAVKLLTAVTHVESSEVCSKSEPVAIPINENGDLKQGKSDLESEKNGGTGCESKTTEKGVGLDVLISEEQAVEFLTAVAHADSFAMPSKSEPVAVLSNENGHLKQDESELESEKNGGTGCESKTSEKDVDLDVSISVEQAVESFAAVSHAESPETSLKCEEMRVHSKPLDEVAHESNVDGWENDEADFVESKLTKEAPTDSIEGNKYEQGTIEANIDEALESELVIASTADEVDKLEDVVELKQVEASDKLPTTFEAEPGVELKPMETMNAVQDDEISDDNFEEAEADLHILDLQESLLKHNEESTPVEILHPQDNYEKEFILKHNEESTPVEILHPQDNYEKESILKHNEEFTQVEILHPQSNYEKVEVADENFTDVGTTCFDDGGTNKGEEANFGVSRKYEDNAHARELDTFLDREAGDEVLVKPTAIVAPNGGTYKYADKEPTVEGREQVTTFSSEPEHVFSSVSHVKDPLEWSSSEISLSDPVVKLAHSVIAAVEVENASENTSDKDEIVGVGDPARVSMLESSKFAKQITNELEEGSSSTCSQSDFRSSMDLSRSIDGQIVTDSDEDIDTDEEEGNKELFDDATLAEILKAASGVSTDGSTTVGSSNGSRMFSVEKPSGLGSSAASLKPGPARSTQSSLFALAEAAAAVEPESTFGEEEKKLHEDVEQIRVKFLRLVHRLGHSPEDEVAAQVLYRLNLAEGIKRGRKMGHTFSLDNVKNKALQLESEGTDDLNFSCTILVLGKTGVGKSATINSIFGDTKSHLNAFQPCTNSVRLISGAVDGVKIRIIDTPGLKTSVVEQASNKKILSNIKNYTKKCPPDIVLYVDRLDMQTRDFNDLPLLRSITSTLGSSIWFNAIVALTHAGSAPPDGPNGVPMSYEIFKSQMSHVVQYSIRQAAGDMRLMNPVALVENHPCCRKNREGEKVLPNGLNWRRQMLLLCYSSKILSEANALLKLQDSSPGKSFGFRLRSPPLPYLLSSFMQSRQYPKLANDQGVDNGDSDIDLDDFSGNEQEEEEDDYDSLPTFKPLRKSQLAKLTREQRKAYFEEYDYRVKLLQKKQWKEEIKRLKELKKGKSAHNEFTNDDMVDEYDQDGAPATVQVPLPDMVLPPSFDGDNPAYRYRLLEPTSQILTRPVLDTHGWDHDCGYDGVSIEQTLALVNCFPASVAVQITKDKREFNIHLDSSISAKHGENASSLAGFDIQSIGRQFAYIARGETKFKNLKKNKVTTGVSVTFLGETVATGLKMEDQISIGRRLSLVATTGAVRAQGDTAIGANIEARLREKDYPIGQVLATLGLSLMRWHGDLALGANLQSNFSAGRSSKVVVRAGLNNKLSGQITIMTSTSEHIQIAFLGIGPLLVYILRCIWPGQRLVVS